jgi:hypothetical protein
MSSRVALPGREKLMLKSTRSLRTSAQWHHMYDFFGRYCLGFIANHCHALATNTSASTLVPKGWRLLLVLRGYGVSIICLFERRVPYCG